MRSTARDDPADFLGKGQVLTSSRNADLAVVKVSQDSKPPTGQMTVVPCFNRLNQPAVRGARRSSRPSWLRCALTKVMPKCWQASFMSGTLCPKHHLSS